MATAHVSFNVDEDLKRKFDKKCEDAGVEKSKAFTTFMRDVANGKLTISNDGVVITK